METQADELHEQHKTKLIEATNYETGNPKTKTKTTLRGTSCRRNG